MVGVLNIFAMYLGLRTLGPNVTVNHYVLMILVNIVVALYIFTDVPRLEKIAGEYFSKQKEERYKVLERELKTCTVFISLTDLVEFVAKLLEEKMQIMAVAVYLKDKNRDSNYFRVVRRGAATNEHTEMLAKDNALITFLKKNPDYIETGEFRHKYEHLYRNGKILDHEKHEIQSILEKNLFAAMVLPVIQNDELGGFIVLGDKKSGFAYNTRDLQFLEKLIFDFGLTLENLKLKEHLVDKEKLIMIGTIAASLAHEIHNPLTSVKTLVELLPARTGHQDFIESFMTIVPRDIDRVIAITRGLEAFALPTPSMPTVVNVKFVIEEVLALLQNQINSRQVEIVTEIDEAAEITADTKKINQLFMNFILNACQASKAGNKIIIKAKRGEDKDGVAAILAEVIDEGEGIKPEELQNIFKPFYSTRIYGIGLGLPTCKRIIEEHKGEITVESHVGKGTKITIALPINQ